MHRWLENISLYRGSLQETLAFLIGRKFWSTVAMLRRFLGFMTNTDRRHLVFADEKPMKEKMIYRKVRRCPRTGHIPNHMMNANSKNCFNILAAVNIKGCVARPVEYVILKCTTNALFFYSL